MPERACRGLISPGFVPGWAAVLLLAIGLSLAPAGVTSARAQSADIYTIAGIEIDTTGENDLAAKRAGVAEAKSRAFRALVDRLTVEGDGARLATPDAGRLEFLIRDVTFDQEKFGGGRYLAELTVRFQPDAIRELMAREGIAFAETKSRPLVVVPVLDGPGGAPVLWLGGNDWLDAWLETPTAGGLVPIIAPLGDLDDISAIDARAALAGDDAALAALAEAHDAGGTVVAHATPTPDGAAVTVAITVEADGWPPYASEARFAAPPPGSEGEEAASADATAESAEAEADPAAERTRAMAAAVTGTIARLEEAWTRENLIRHDLGGTTLAVRAPLRGLGDLVAVRRALERAAPVKTATLDRLTTGEATFEVTFVGDIYQLQTALVQGGLTLDLSEDATTWLLRRRGAAESAASGASASGAGTDPDDPASDGATSQPALTQ